MAKSFAFINCSNELCNKINKIVRQYDFRSNYYQELVDYITLLDTDDIDDVVAIIQLTDVNFSSLQSNIEKLAEVHNFLSIIIIYDHSLITISETMEAFIDYELDVHDDMNKIRRALARASRLADVKRKLQYENNTTKKKHTIDAFIGKSKLAKDVREMMKKLASLPISSLFISGETGTGKGLAARILHAQDEHQSGPLVEVNCSAIPKDLLESELFGHEAGAFTGAKKTHKGYLELANEGTLFLDEITEMDIEVQAKLLKALEDGVIRRVGGERDISIDIAIIAATNRDPREAIDQHLLREDLYHRLNVFCLDLPSLRSRKEDLLDLVPAIISEFNIKSGKNINIVEDSTWDKFMQYDWPGNIRELRNAIERCVLLSDGEVFNEKWMAICDEEDEVVNDTQSELMLYDLDTDETQKDDETQVKVDKSECTFPLDGTISLEEMEKEIIKRGLESQKGNVTETARLLCISREKLRYRIKKHSLDV